MEWNGNKNGNKLIRFNIFREESIAYLEVYLYSSFYLSISTPLCSMSCFHPSRAVAAATLCIFGKIATILACFRNRFQVLYSSLLLLTFSPFSDSSGSAFMILVSVAIF